MPTIDNLPRPWLLAAMTGVPVSFLVGAERPEQEAETRDRARPMPQTPPADERSNPTPRPWTH
jgi:hypothetical protein